MSRRYIKINPYASHTWGILGLFAALIALLGMPPSASAEFAASNGNAAFFPAAESISLTVTKGEKTEAEVKCGEAGGVGYVYETAGKTGESASEDVPPSNPTEFSKRFAFQTGFAKCKETAGGTTQEATIEASGCQLELSESGESVLTSLRTSQAKTQCAMVITRGECRLEFAAAKKGENENLKGWKVKSVASEEWDVEGSLKGLKIKESGCKFSSKELEGTLAIKTVLLFKQIIGRETTDFGSVMVGGAGRTLTVPIVNRLAVSLYGVTSVFEGTIFLRTADECSGKSTVAANTTCLITIRFLPLNPVLYRGRIELPANGRLPDGTWWGLGAPWLFTLLGTGT